MTCYCLHAKTKRWWTPSWPLRILRVTVQDSPWQRPSFPRWKLPPLRLWSPGSVPLATRRSSAPATPPLASASMVNAANLHMASMSCTSHSTIQNTKRSCAGATTQLATVTMAAVAFLSITRLSSGMHIGVAGTSLVVPSTQSGSVLSAPVATSCMLKAEALTLTLPMPSKRGRSSPPPRMFPKPKSRCRVCLSATPLPNLVSASMAHGVAFNTAFLTRSSPWCRPKGVPSFTPHLGYPCLSLPVLLRRVVLPLLLLHLFLHSPPHRGRLGFTTPLPSPVSTLVTSCFPWPSICRWRPAKLRTPGKTELFKWFSSVPIYIFF